MTTITIRVENRDDAEQALLEVAKLVGEGYQSGLIGWSSDSWEIEEDK